MDIQEQLKTLPDLPGSYQYYDKNNEIAQLNTGDTVEIIEKEDSTYWYVYVPKLGKEGYVDKNYLK